MRQGQNKPHRDTSDQQAINELRKMSVAKLSNREIESLLGSQYARVLKDNKELASIHKDCEDVITGSLKLLEHYNKVKMFMSSKKPAYVPVPHFVGSQTPA